jgi:hypothetical protein
MTAPPVAVHTIYSAVERRDTIAWLRPGPKTAGADRLTYLRTQAARAGPGRSTCVARPQPAANLNPASTACHQDPFPSRPHCRTSTFFGVNAEPRPLRCTVAPSEFDSKGNKRRTLRDRVRWILFWILSARHIPSYCAPQRESRMWLGAVSDRSDFASRTSGFALCGRPGPTTIVCAFAAIALTVPMRSLLPRSTGHRRALRPLR